MNLGLNDDQQMLCDTFARFLDQYSSTALVRQAIGTQGFDARLWSGLAELGTFSMRVPERAGGLDLSTLDAVLVMEQAGRTLASGPLAEAIVAARLIAMLGGVAGGDPLEQVLTGAKVVTIAGHDIADAPLQWVAGGAHADLVVARRRDEVVLARLTEGDRKPEPTLADNGIGEVDLGRCETSVLASGAEAIDLFEAAVEEWKLLCAAALNGLAREAVRLAAEYACERKAFGVPIGTFQALSHPLANFITDLEGGRLLIWKAINAITTGEAGAGAKVPMALWWNARTANAATIQSLRTFGGYGLTTEYDIHLYNLRAKAWPLIHGDPQRLLEQAARRLYAGERSALPDVGEVSIDFELGPKARSLAREVDEFFEKMLTPELKAHAHHSWSGHHPLVHKKLAEAGLLYPELPTEKGGRGASPYESFAANAVWEKHGWSAHAKGTTMMIAAIIERFGGEELKREVLEPILAGEVVCSLGYTEPDSGSDVFAVQTRATRDGDGWRIDGTKMFTSGADLSDYAIMLTRTNPEVAKHKGLTMFMVPLKAEGVTIQPVHTFQDERSNITFYDGVRVPDSYRLGEVDGGVRTMSAALELEQGIAFSETQMNVVRAAEDLCRRIRFGKGTLIEDDLARMRLARAWTHCFVAEVLELRSLWSAEEKLGLPAAGPMAKVFSTEKFLEDANDLLDLTAPLSLSKRKGEADLVNVAYRFAHGSTIWAGTSEIHRSMIAERALGLPRSRG